MKLKPKAISHLKKKDLIFVDSWFLGNIQSKELFHLSFYNFETKNVSKRARSSFSSFQNDTNKPILLERLEGNDKGICVLSLNHPKVNALSRKLLDSMQECLKTFEEDNMKTIRTVIIRSNLESKIFCAGADLKERETMTPKETSEFVQLLRNTFTRIERLPQPVIASIDGTAVGGGLELALACDIRVAGKNAILGLVETSLAIIPGAGGTQRLPRVVGISKAKELIFTARKFDGSYAECIGLLDSWNATQESSMDKALTLAREIVNNGPVAIAAAKQAINESFAPTVQNMSAEKNAYDRVIPTKDRLEALAAFKEKRKPSFKGE
ncbi:hypothetical protein RFI_05793 [Reticulomyxa filosa]|uniref:Enoyl-CoA hydratase n=1 Tax=Reticulomyxa filosa TaxID=46433 RepID=X6NZD5_RETFI|nr:hypothetical protein RFI_05793 [Reticulomyxa filosa]|eukprot:ETO31326.1 hypothetical protein RFI_05793 [Reticulomyxa filosa]